MITRKNIMEPILRASPSFRPAWDESVAYWQEQSDDLIYSALGELARHIAHLLEQGADSELRAIFAIVEDWHANGDDDVQNAATVGLLESLQGSLGAENPEIVSYLGPKSSRGWIDLIAFWDGDGAIIRSEYYSAGNHLQKMIQANLKAISSFLSGGNKNVKFEPPADLEGAVILWAFNPVKPFFIMKFHDGTDYKPIHGFIIYRYKGEESFYVTSLDRDWTIEGDSDALASVEEAVEIAQKQSFEPITWNKLISAVRSHVMDYHIYRTKSELEGTAYIEVIPGRYAREHWRDGSLFVREDAFSFAEGVVARHFPGYDHFTINDIPKSIGERIIAEWRAIADRLLEMRSADAKAALNPDVWLKADYDGEIEAHRADISALLRGLAEGCEDFYSKGEWISILGM